MASKSYLHCDHPPSMMQSFTDCCLQCGYNVWTTKQEYFEILSKQSILSQEEEEDYKLLLEMSKQGLL